jgi:hypothetical protein
VQDAVERVTYAHRARLGGSVHCHSDIGGHISRRGLLVGGQRAGRLVGAELSSGRERRGVTRGRRISRSREVARCRPAGRRTTIGARGCCRYRAGEGVRGVEVGAHGECNSNGHGPDDGAPGQWRVGMFRCNDFPSLERLGSRRGERERARPPLWLRGILGGLFPRAAVLRPVPPRPRSAEPAGTCRTLPFSFSTGYSGTR